MTKDNTSFFIAFASIFLIGGAVWSFGLALREQPNFIAVLTAGSFIIIGVFILAFTLRNTRKWAVL